MNNFQKPQGIAFAFRGLDAAILARALCLTASLIQNSEPYGLKLQKYEDWWQHDGLRFAKGVLSLHELFEMVESPRSLLWATPADSDVCVGIAPEKGGWYLRFRLEWDDAGFDLTGTFDFIVPPQWESRFEAEVVANLAVLPEKWDAESFYRRILGSEV
ncbi:MAG: hypothetical protein KY445_11795 [Armatimonadetes bacterium]|nr:hypothetical protein [Armatimonadota bacterium]